MKKLLIAPERRSQTHRFLSCAFPLYVFFSPSFSLCPLCVTFPLSPLSTLLSSLVLVHSEGQRGARCSSVGRALERRGREGHSELIEIQNS